MRMIGPLVQGVRAIVYITHGTYKCIHDSAIKKVVVSAHAPSNDNHVVWSIFMDTFDP